VRADWPTFTGSLNRLARVKGFTSKPAGFKVVPELVERFEGEFTGEYMNPGFEKEDLIKAFSRYDSVATIYDPKVLNKAIAWTRRVFAPYMVREFATHEEVCENFNPDSSTGFPYNEHWQKKGDMRDMIGFEWLKDVWVNWLKEPYQPIFKHFLKEELRKVGKDTRGILCGAIDVEYVMQRFFLSSNKGFYEAFLRTPSAVGISRDGLQWNTLFRKLAKFRRGFSADYKKYDSKMMQVLLNAARDLRKSFLMAHQKWAEPYLDHIYDILSNTVCLVDGELVQKSGGNPSGGPCTTPDNTLVGIILQIYAYLELNPDKGFENWRDELSSAVYGDDNDVTMNEDKCVFDPDSVAEVLHNAFGYEITHGGLVPVEQLTFLSAGFKPVPLVDASVMVPIFNRDKMICHIVQSRTTDPYLEFQRLSSIRQLCAFDDLIVERLDAFLLAHRADVTAKQWEAFVPPIDVVRHMYMLPKRKREPQVLEEPGLNSA